ncbi:sporulation integral membrane protein YtvI [Desulfitobacterium sp. Sab5]|uniref:sporulation integral membrane protein YtvI n=1 Tax=Desulfitobacterium TaxID=36853 RepID=UPI003CF22D6B
MNLITRTFLNRTLKFIGFWIIIGLTIYFVGHFIYLFIPFILAFIMTAIIGPLKRFLIREFHFPRNLAVLTAMIIEIGGFGTLLILLLMRIVREIQDIYFHWPHYSHILQITFAHWVTRIETLYLKLPQDYVGGYISKFFNYFSGLLTHSLSVAITIPEAIIVIVIAIVATFFMSKESHRYIRDFINIFPHEWRNSLIELGSDFSKAFVGFVKAEFIIFIITLIVCISGLLLFKAKYAIILGTITGIFGILPVLGVGIVLVPWSLFAFVAGNNVLAIELLLLTSVVTVLRHVIEPKILGDNVGLDPLFVLISMYMGLASTGVIGLILGPFILIAYKSLQKAGVFRNL